MRGVELFASIRLFLGEDAVPNGKRILCRRLLSEEQCRSHWNGGVERSHCRQTDECRRCTLSLHIASFEADRNPRTDFSDLDFGRSFERVSGEKRRRMRVLQSPCYPHYCVEGRLKAM